jgi:hypothetical protein
VPLRERLGFGKKPENKAEPKPEAIEPDSSAAATAGAPPAAPAVSSPTVAAPVLPPIQKPEQKRVNPAVGQRPAAAQAVTDGALQTGAPTLPGAAPGSASAGPSDRTAANPMTPRVAPGAPVPGQPRTQPTDGTQGPITQPLPIVPGPTAGTQADAHSGIKGAGAPRRTRKARLRLSRLDPWSVMKTAFLFSIAAGIMLVIAVYAVWVVLSTSQLFESVNEIVKSVVSTPGDTTPFRIQEYVNTQKVLGIAALIAVVDVVILTALATLGSFLYNLAATMLGGLEITLAED